MQVIEIFVLAQLSDKIQPNLSFVLLDHVYCKNIFNFSTNFWLIIRPTLEVETLESEANSSIEISFGELFSDHRKKIIDLADTHYNN